MQRQNLIVIALLVLGHSLSAGTTGSIDANVTNQYIRGFGASSAWNGSGTLAPAAAVLWANDNIDGHIGMSMLRTRIDPGGSFAGEAAAMTLAKAQNPNLLIWSTEWTPPAAYKNNNSVNGPGATNTFNNTAANSTAYANYLVNYIKTIKNTYGVTLYAISPQNEPDWNTSYESCLWDANQFNDFVKTYLAPAISAAGLSTKIMIPESFADNLSLAATAMNDATTAPLVSIIGNHLYGGGPRPLSAGGFSHLTNQESWETEMSDVSGVTHDPGMTPALQIAGWIHSCMVTASMNAYHHWWIYSYTGEDSGLYGTDTTTATKKLYVLGNYSKFIRPGYYRMGGTINANATGVNISAYKDQQGTAQNFVIVAVNTTGAAVNETFTLSNFSPVSFTPWVTDASNNLVHKAGVAVSGGSFTYSLPAQSVVSFVCNTGPALSPTPSRSPTPYAGTPTFTITASPTPSTQLFDDFEDVNTADNWGGSWFTYAGAASSVTLTVAGPGAPASALGRLQASGSIADYGGIGATFSGSPRDLSSYVGISFKVRGSGTYWFQLNQANIADGDNFGATFTPTGSWTTVTLYFNALSQRGFGAASTLDLTQIANFQWASNANGALNFELDDVQLLTYSLPTATVSPTRTSTATASASPSSSATRTRTGTPSATATATPSNTANATSTSSASPSATRTSSPTDSVTPSRTMTAALPSSTPSSSSTATLSATLSASPSPMATGTPTRSSSPTSSGTPTRTALPSATASVTPTLSGTPSASRTATVAITPTVTDTVTDGPSSTASVTPSQTPPPTATATATLSGTSSSTRTVTLSVTSTDTVTDGPSATPSSTATASSTALATASPTITPSRTVTPPASTSTATSSSTPSQTAVPPSATPTSTLSPIPPTASATRTTDPSPVPPTATLTVTPDPSPLPASPTPTRTRTATPALTTVPSPVPTALTPLAIEQVWAVPNPNPSSIALKLSGNADKVILRIWSVGFQLLQTYESGAVPAGWSNVALPWVFQRYAPNGTYYLTVEVQRAGLKAGSKPVKFVVLR